MKSFRLAAAVPADLQAAHDFYARRSRVAADRFLAAYVETRDRLVAQPLLCRVRPHGWRQAAIRKFPRYAIFHQEKKAVWLVAAVAPTVQAPDNLLATLLIREAAEEAE